MAAMTDAERRRELGQQFRVDSVRMSAAAKSGHPTSAMSAADLMAVLVDGYLRYDFDEPKSPRTTGSSSRRATRRPPVRDLPRRGASATRRSSATASFGSPLEGHPTPSSRGSTSRRARSGRAFRSASAWRSPRSLERLPSRVWVLCGDSEMAEGSMWEAFEHAAHYELDNLTAILDVNRLGQRGETMVGWDLDVHASAREPFGWHAVVVDGHDVDAIDRAYAEAIATSGRPTVIVARTVKGKGVAAVEDMNGFHGKPLDDPDAAIAELGGLRDIRIEVAKPDVRRGAAPVRDGALELPRYEVGTEVATRKAYGDALAALGSARGDVVVLDGEVSNSTFAEIFAKAHPERYFEMYIAEQQMVAAAVGLQAVGWRPFASTFAAFLTRAYDFVRMAAVSRANLALCGSHAGVSIGEDGPSQMGLEDIAALRAVHGSTVLHPCDANQTARSSSPRWPTRTGSRTSARCAPRRRCSTGPTRSSRSAAAASCARPRTTTSRSSAPGSPCTRRSGRGPARRGRDRRARDRPLLDQAARRDTLLVAAEGNRRQARDGRGPLARGRPRRGGPERGRRTGRAPASSRSRYGACPARASRTSCLAAAGIDAEHIAAAARRLVRRPCST